ncbi:MAG: ROK family protein [Phycisphaerae bacterium]|jgi:glucokinase|nr:ROK family protein [Phycisphaerae bacterium]
MARKYYLGIDLGGTNIKTGVVDDDAKLLSKYSTPTCVEGNHSDTILKRMGQAGEIVIEQAGITVDDIAAIGVGSPGVLNHKEGFILAQPNIQGWKNVPVRDIISRYFKNKLTTLENDANVAAWGEFWAGVGKGTNSLVLLTLGTGVGGGIVYGGRFIRGYRDNAAELGHIIVEPGGRRCNCGQLGCLEAYASATNSAKIATEQIRAGRPTSMKAVLEEKGAITTETILTHMLSGDALAKELWLQTCRYIALGCLTLNHTINAEIIALAGGMVGAGDHLLNPVRQFYHELQGHVFNNVCSNIVLAKLGNDAGFVGAAGAAKLRLEAGEW